MISTKTALVSFRCPEHGTYRAPSGEPFCPACPKPEPVAAPIETADFPSDEDE